MFAVILWWLFAHFGWEIADWWTSTAVGIEVGPAHSLFTSSPATSVRFQSVYFTNIDVLLIFDMPTLNYDTNKKKTCLPLIIYNSLNT